MLRTDRSRLRPARGCGAPPPRTSVERAVRPGPPGRASAPSPISWTGMLSASSRPFAISASTKDEVHSTDTRSSLMRSSWHVGSSPRDFVARAERTGQRAVGLSQVCIQVVLDEADGPDRAADLPDRRTTDSCGVLPAKGCMRWFRANGIQPSIWRGMRIRVSSERVPLQRVRSTLPRRPSHDRVRTGEGRHQDKPSFSGAASDRTAWSRRRGADRDDHP